MRMTRLSSCVGLLAVIAMLAGSCGRKKEISAPDGRLEVATGLAPVGSLIRAVGGDSVAVTVLLESGADPEQFDPGATAMKSLSKSRVFFTLGMLPFEKKIVGNLDNHTAACNITENIEPIWGTHGDEADPHVWMSVRNLKAMAQTVAAELCRTRPSAYRYFKSRLEQLENKLDSLDCSWNARIAPLKGKAFVVGHPTLSYFTRDYPVRQIATGAEGHKEQTARDIRNRIDEAKGAGAKLIFAQPGNEGRMARDLATQLGAEIVEFDPMSPETLVQLETVVDKLTETYGK